MGLRSFLLGLDRFGQPVTVNFEGEDAYKTQGGAFCSLLTYIIVIVFAIVQVQQLINLDNPNIQQTVEFVNYATNNDKFNVAEQELDAVIKLEIMRPDGTKSWDSFSERYGRVIAYQKAQLWPFEVERRLQNEEEGGRGRRRRLETLESVADWYMDAGLDTSGEVTDADSIFPMNSCNRPEHLKGVDPEEKERIISQNLRKCIDLSKADMSGGTIDGATEHVVVIQFQHCTKFKPKEECATKEEFERDLEDVKLTLEIFNNFVTFSDPYKTVSVANVPTILLDTHQEAYKNVRGHVRMSPNQAQFMDKWYSVLPNYDTEDNEFLSVDSFEQKQADPPTDPDMPNFGFTFVLTRSPKLLIHSRQVYTVLEFLGDVGGLDGSLVLLLAPLMSLFSGSMYMRRVLNGFFKYDDSKPVWQPSKQFKNMLDKQQNQNQHAQGILERISNQAQTIELSRADLMSLKQIYDGLRKFKVGLCSAITGDYLSGSCLKSRSIKRYLKGKQQIEKRLDVVHLVKTSLDLDILRKLYLLPRQRALWHKQRQRALRVRDYSGSNSGSSIYSDDNTIYDASRKTSLANYEFKNQTDRQLLLGAVKRNSDLSAALIQIEMHKRFTPPIPNPTSASALHGSQMMLQDIEDVSLTHQRNFVLPFDKTQDLKSVEPRAFRLQGKAKVSIHQSPTPPQLLSQRRYAEDFESDPDRSGKVSRFNETSRQQKGLQLVARPPIPVVITPPPISPKVQKNRMYKL